MLVAGLNTNYSFHKPFEPYLKQICEAGKKIPMDNGKEWSKYSFEYLQKGAQFNFPSEINCVAIKALQVFADHLQSKNRVLLLQKNQNVIFSLLQITDPYILDLFTLIHLASLNKELGIYNDLVLHILSERIYKFFSAKPLFLLQTLGVFSQHSARFPRVFKYVSQMIVFKNDSIPSHHLTQLVESFVQSHVFPDSLFLLIAEKMPHRIEEFTANNLASLLYCFAQFKHIIPEGLPQVNSNLLWLMQDKIFSKLHTFKAQRIFKIIWSLDALNMLSRDLEKFYLLTERVKNFQSTFSLKNLMVLYKIFVQSKIKDFSIVSTLAETIKDKIDLFSFEELKDFLQANRDDTVLLTELSGAIKNKISFFSLEDLRFFLKIVIESNLHDLSLIKTFAETIKNKIDLLPPEQTVKILAMFAIFFNQNPHFRSSFPMDIFEEYSKKLMVSLKKFTYKEREILDSSFLLLKVDNPFFNILLETAQNQKNSN